MDPLTPTPLTVEALPHPAAPPIHLFPEWVQPVAWLALFVLMVVLWVWINRRLARRTPPPTSVPAPPVSSVPAAAGGITDSINEVKRTTCRSGLYRDGCHTLSSLVRGFLQARTGQPVETATADEVERILGDPALAGYFVELETLQYGRDNPEKEAFVALCEHSLTAVAEKSPGRRS